MLEPRDRDRYVRELAAMLNRAIDEDPEGFADIAILLETAVRLLPAAAQGMRSRGFSWRQLAAAMGASVSTVHARYRTFPWEWEGDPTDFGPRLRLILARSVEDNRP